MNTFSDTSKFKLVKLINGEDLVCTIEEENETHINLICPLKMQVIPKMSAGRIEESLNLSPWIHPYTEAHSFKIAYTSIMLMTDVSPGLTRYYEYVLKKIDEEDIFEDDLGDNISKEEIYDELLESIEPDSNSIH